MEGIVVAPAVTDTNFEGEIKVMTNSQNGVNVVNTGQTEACKINFTS